MNEHDETIIIEHDGDAAAVRDPRGRVRAHGAFRRTIVCRRAGRSERDRERHRVATVPGRRSVRSAAMDQRRLRVGHQQKPVVPRLPAVLDDR